MFHSYVSLLQGIDLVHWSCPKVGERRRIALDGTGMAILKGMNHHEIFGSVPSLDIADIASSVKRT